MRFHYDGRTIHSSTRNVECLIAEMSIISLGQHAHRAINLSYYDSSRDNAYRKGRSRAGVNYLSVKSAWTHASLEISLEAHTVSSKILRKVLCEIR